MEIDDDVSQESPAADPVKMADGWPCFREHSLFESAVIEAARELQVSREMAMMCAFGAMATACQGLVNVQMPVGPIVPTSLMLLTIAESGERKTTTQNYFFQAINGLNNAAHRSNDISRREHRVELQLWNTHKRYLEREYSRQYRTDKTAAEATMAELEAYIRGEPIPPRSGKFLYEDTTPQALVQMLYENTPNACLLTSEASSIFSGKALGELDKLNTLWDGNSVIVDRLSREGFTLQGARLTLALMAQPSVIASFMGKRGAEARGTGFLARFLVAKPQPKAGRRKTDNQSEQPRRKDFNDRIYDRLTIPVPSERQVLRFSEEAATLWRGYNQELEEHMRENGLYHYAKDHASKLLENVSRLAAILHAFEYGIDSATEISAFTLKFCWKFARVCSRHFIDYLANEPQFVTDANLLENFLLKRAANEPRNKRELSPEEKKFNFRYGLVATVTLTDIKQFGPGCLRGRANSERLEASLELLTKLGHLKKAGSHYHFSEAIQLKSEPPVKNGEFLSVKELPLFAEQERWQQPGLNGNASRYVIKVN